LHLKLNKHIMENKELSQEESLRVIVDFILYYGVYWSYLQVYRSIY